MNTRTRTARPTTTTIPLRRIGHLLPLAVLCFALLLTNAAGAPPPACEAASSIRFSMVPLGNFERTITHYQPLFRRIERLTGRAVSVVRPGSYASVVEGLLAGNIDIASLGPASYVDARNGDARITPFATMDKRAGSFQVAGPHFNAMLIVLNDSPFDDLAALRNARVVLTDPGSTSGSLLPRKRFSLRVGMPLEAYFASVSYSGSHGKSLAALLQGQVDAAFVSSAQLEEARIAGALSPAQVRTLWTSDAIPYDPFVYRGQLCGSLVTRIRVAFLADEASAELDALLQHLNARRFIPVDDSHYTGIRKLLDE